MSSSHHSTAGARCRVGFIQPSFLGYREAFYRQLAEQGFDVSLWADLSTDQTRGAAALSESVRVYDAPLREIGPFRWQPAMMQAAQNPELDVVVTGWNIRYLGLARALRMAHGRGSATVLWGHGYGKRENRLARWYRNRLIQFADAVVLYGESARQRLLNEGFPGRKLFVAPNAIDQSPIQRARREWSPSALEAFRQAHGLVDRTVLVFVSRLQPRKRVDLLLQAVGRARYHRPDLHLVVIGDGAERSALEDLAGQVAPGAVTFVGGLFDESALAPWMMSASCCVHPRAIGLSILHAFGYGVPVITCSAPGDHGPEFDALRPGINGLTFADGDVQEFAAQIDVMLSNREKLAAMARAAEETARANDMPAMVQAFAEAIRFALKNA